MAVFAEYAIYDLKQGLTAAEKKQIPQALAFFAQALQRVPYALPPRFNQCTLLDDSSQRAACMAKYQVHKSISFEYLP